MDSRIFDIINFVIKAHDGQRHKGDAPYCCHPIRVAKIIKENGGDFITVVSALLHDVIEDAKIGQDAMSKEVERFLIGLEWFTKEEVTKILQIVHSLSLQDYENKIEAMQRLSAPGTHPEAVFVKIGDLIDNYKDASPEKTNKHKARAEILAQTYKDLFPFQAYASLNYCYPLFIQLKEIFGI